MTRRPVRLGIAALLTIGTLCAPAAAEMPSAAGPPPLPIARPSTVTGGLSPSDAAWRTTLAFAEAGEWERSARVRGRQPDPTLQALLEWLRLSDTSLETDFTAIAGFLLQHRSWPGESALEARAEELMPDTMPASARLHWFAQHPPRTTNGRLAHLEALAAAGDPAELVAAVRRVWREVEFGPQAEATFLARYGRHLRPADHEQRLDGMLWRGRAGAARQTMRHVSEGWRRLADARLRLRFDKAGVDAAVTRVPAALQQDPGLVYERIRWRRRHGFEDGARELLVDAPESEEFQGLWWRERVWQIREALDARDYRQAYRLSATHIQQRGVAFAEAEWLAGWIALRFLDRPADALRHFGQIYGNVTSPISLGRAAYWAGRAAEAAGDSDQARDWYRLGSAQPTTFYGQLAAARLGSDAVVLPPATVPRADRRRAFDDSDLVKATRALIRIDRPRLASRFLRTLAVQAEDGDEAYLVAELAAASGVTSAAVFAVRHTARLGNPLVEFGYPVMLLPPDSFPETALVHAIIRQESGFDPGAISRAGARGLMQLMPATARQTAGKLSLEYDLGNLIADPDYNLALGRGYLGEMLQRFGGNYVLAIAAYNAGPHRAEAWTKRHGHPADPSVDVIDWIEMIPFAETRNYVQRVLEALHVYRARLSIDGAPALGSTAAQRSPLDVWCVYACGVLLDRGDATLNQG